MYPQTKTTFEFLPDEMILEICRYLHCSHVLYSLYDLNSRLNRTITSYCQHVWFRRASYKQLLYIYEYILPRIGQYVISLTIHPLHQASFPLSFKNQLSNIFPNLRTLTLTSWTSENLLLIMIEGLHKFNCLEKLVIQELSCSMKIDDRHFLEKIFNLKTNFLKTILFDYDCDSFHLNNQLNQDLIYEHIYSLTIQLDTLVDFSILIQFIPNIYQLDVSIKNSSLKPVVFKTTLAYLKDFSLWSIHYYSHFDDLIPLFTIVPSIEQFSLTISTRDSYLINGNKLLSILPTQLKQFNYTVCYYPHENCEPIDIENFRKSWQSFPIVYSISEIDKRIFLHTIPYASSRLMIRSNLAKNIPSKGLDQIYTKIDQIQVYTMNNIVDTFPIIGQCRRVRELTLLTANEAGTSNSLTTSTANSNKQVLTLPYLGRLDILTIEGTPSDLHNLKDLLVAAPNFIHENISLIAYVLLHQHILDLCIRIQENPIENNRQINKPKLTIEKIHNIARIFSRVRNLTIDYEISEDDIQPNIIQSVIYEFKQLVIFHIYGKIPEHMLQYDIRQWIIEQIPFRLKSTDVFRVECNSGWFKLWL